MVGCEGGDKFPTTGARRELGSLIPASGFLMSSEKIPNFSKMRLDSLLF
jgi:hypothetical protein